MRISTSVNWTTGLNLDHGLPLNDQSWGMCYECNVQAKDKGQCSLGYTEHVQNWQVCCTILHW